MLGAWWVAESHGDCPDSHHVPGQINMSKELWRLTTVREPTS